MATATAIAGVYADSLCTLSAKSNTNESVTVTLKGLPGATYRRKISWFFKLSTEKTYTRHAYHFIAANETPAASYQYNYTTGGISKLIPGKTYNFMVTITDTRTGSEYVKKYVSATVVAAKGSFTLSTTPTKVTAKITGLKSVAYYGRCVYSYLDRGNGWELWNKTFIAANATAPTTITHTFSPAGIMGKTLKVKAVLSTGTSKDKPVTTYLTMATKSVTVPYNGISVPEVTDVSYTAPASTMSVSWGLSYNYTARSAATTYTFYVKRQNGTVINAGSVTGWQNKSPYQIDISSWLCGEEKVSVYIKATDSQSTATATSPKYDITLDRLFHWDTEKVAGEEFSITAGEWNRMVNYINAAAELYPDYFSAVVGALVSSGEELTASLVNTVFPVVDERISSILYEWWLSGSSNPPLDFYNTVQRLDPPAGYSAVKTVHAAYLLITDPMRGNSTRSINAYMNSSKVLIPKNQDCFAFIDDFPHTTVTRMRIQVVMTCTPNRARQYTNISAKWANSVEKKLQAAMRDATGL